jgi:fluoride exporter
VTTERPRRERQVRHDLLVPHILAVVAAGGALGASARYGLDLLLPHGPGQIPWPTLLANVVGSFLVGVTVVWLLERRHPSRWAHPLLATGVLGGFTTFSTYAVQTRLLVGEGQGPLAAAYLLGTLVLALLAVRVGTVAARRMWGLVP